MSRLLAYNVYSFYPKYSDFGQTWWIGCANSVREQYGVDKFTSICQLPCLNKSPINVGCLCWMLFCWGVKKIPKCENKWLQFSQNRTVLFVIVTRLVVNKFNQFLMLESTFNVISTLLGSRLMSSRLYFILSTIAVSYTHLDVYKRQQ